MKIKNNNESPIDLLVVIVPRNDGRKVCEILDKYNIHLQLNCMGHGTAKSNIADLFGFGISERDVVFSIIPTEKGNELLDFFNKTFEFEKKDNGLAMTLPINIIEKKLFNLINI